MKYRIKILSVICFCAIFSVVGCAEKSTDRQYPVTSSKIVQINTEGGGKSEMKNSAEMLRDNVSSEKIRQYLHVTEEDIQVVKFSLFQLN